MKISKKTLLAISILLNISALWLMFASAADRDLFMDIHNAVHHINELKIISTWNDTTSATLSNTGGLVRIDTNNYILWETWDKKNTLSSTNSSSILWWEKNTIMGSYNIILGWSGNITRWTHNTILWWEWNNIVIETCWSMNTILWWKNNNISWGTYTPGASCLNYDDKNYSVIIWGHDNNIYGNYSVVMWNNSSVEWTGSTALWSWSHIQADNSFLWTDGNSPETLETNDVFVIMAQNWAIINTNKAHSFAKLTLWWPLVLSTNNNQSGALCEWWQWGGIIKIEKSDNNQLCLCSCDGFEWNSMFSNWACSKVCNKSIESPICGSVDRICPYRIMYSWHCINWKVIEWTWAYFVDKDNVIHRSCQTQDGQVASCSGTVSQDMQHRQECIDRIWVCAGGWSYDPSWHACNSDIECAAWYALNPQTNQCELIWTCKNANWRYYAGDKTDFENKITKGFFSPNNKYNRYMPIWEQQTDLKRTCVSKEEAEQNPHSCKFACADGYDCGSYREWDTSQSRNDIYETCLQEKRCYWDYTYLEHPQVYDIYQNIVYDGIRRWNVYKNPTEAIKQSATLNRFTYVNTMEELESIEAAGTPWCYVVCDTSTHVITDDNLRWAWLYESVEWAWKRIRPYYAWYCYDNCIDINTNGYALRYKWKAEWDGGQGYTRREWHYTWYDNFQYIENHDNGSKDNACIWTCNGDMPPILIKKDSQDDPYPTVIDENEGTDITNRFFNDYSNQKPEEYLMNNAICWNQCGYDEYFWQWRNHNCIKIPKWYKIDSGYYIEYKGIKNYTKIIAKTCPPWTTMDYTTGECKETHISLQNQCTNQNNQPWRWNWYYRENNECKICPVWQYHTTNWCEDCPNLDAPDCVKNI